MTKRVKFVLGHKVMFGSESFKERKKILRKMIFFNVWFHYEKYKKKKKLKIYAF